jgi:hypothetical protein
MREALRTAFEPEGGLSAEPRPNWRFDNQADDLEGTDRALP